MASIRANLRFLTRYPLALGLVLLAAPAEAAPVIGINLSGCEFYAPGDLCPTSADVNAAIDQGFRMIRLPFKGPQAKNPVVVAKLQAGTNAAVRRGADVILDRHDFVWPAPAEQVAFWTGLLPNFPDSDHVLIDLMNEPQGFTDKTVSNAWMEWARDTNKIIAGIREAGFKHRILVEWPGWSALRLFDGTEKASQPCASAACALDRSGGLRDPLNRTLLSPHRYFDKDGSGTNTECNPGLAPIASNFPEFAAAARKRGLRAIVTEFAFGSSRGVPESCVPVGKAAMAAIRAAPDVFVGATVWGGGRGWSENYTFRIVPKVGRGKTARVASPYLDMLLGDPAGRRSR